MTRPTSGNVGANAVLARWCMLCVSVLALTGCAAQQQAKLVQADWHNPTHRLVAEQLSPLLEAAGRDPDTCEVVFVESEHLSAASLGNCTFGFTTGLAETHDARLIAGVAAHEVAHEALAHAEKRQTIGTLLEVVLEVAKDIPGWGGLATTLAVIPVSMVAMPAYARAQETAADTKAVEILRARGDAAPAGTMVYGFETLLAREGNLGGGLLASHPAVSDRLAALRQLQGDEPFTGPAPQEAAAQPVVVLPRALRRPEFFVTKKPPDPRAGWPERYKKMAEMAAAQEKEAESRENAGTNAKVPE